MLTHNLPYLAPILLVSILIVAIIIERAALFLQLRNLKSRPLAQAFAALEAGKMDEAAALFEGHNSPSAQIFRKGMDMIASGQAALVTKLSSKAQGFVSLLEQRVGYLSAGANIATLLGLFGTVAGMVISFAGLQTNGGADAAAVTQGISQALVATVAGLLVAIPSLTAYSVFTQLIGAHAERMEIVIAELAAWQEAKTAAAAAEGEAP